MKKKLLALVLVVALAATAVIGGTLAYFTDTDSAVNTFTVGNVKIDLIEQQRATNDDGTKSLVNFENGKTLYPIVTSAQNDGHETVGGFEGLPLAKNYVDKIITVKNEQKDAYVRVYVAIPTVLDNVGDASQNILHFNTTAQSSEDGEWGTETLVAQGYVIDETDGIEYNIYYRTYKTALAKNASTATPAYVGFYLDKNVDYNGTNYTINGNVINFDMTNIKVPVFAVGVQAEGFTDADAAMTAAFGANYNPF